MLSPLALLLPLVLQAAAAAAPQAEQDVPDLVRRLLDRPPPVETRERSRSILPTIGASPAAGTSFGVLLSAQGRSAEGARIGVLTANASYSTKDRGQVVVRLDQPLPGSAWRLVGDWRYYTFTERTYGLGRGTTSDRSLDVPLDWGRVHATVYRHVRGALEIGGGYHFDVRQVHDLAGTSLPIENRILFASGVSADAAYDTRDNVINANRGWLARTSVAWFPTALGSDRSWQSTDLEARAYWRVRSPRRQVVAAWWLSRLTTSGDPGYFDLPSTGWDAAGRSARGYAAGRYRGRSWLDAEAEYRVDLRHDGLIGAVVFASASTLSDARDRFGPWRPAGGAGIRIKLDKRHGSNLCVDYGWGVEGSRGLFLALNEAF